MAPLVPSTSPDKEFGGSRLTRIVVTGSESTGKTELAQQLAAHYRVCWVAEFAREYAEQHPRALTSADVDPIGSGQIAREDATLRNARGLVILDTDLLSTFVYGTQYYGSVPGWIAKTVEERLADLYLVCDIDVPWVADAVRDAQRQRRQMHAAFIHHLQQFGASYRIVRGSGSERLACAIAHISAWRESS